MFERLGLLLDGRHARQLVERRDPLRDRRREGLAEERPEWHVFERLDVARAPVVDEDGAEHVLQRAVDRHRLAELRRLADDEAELELDVQLLRRAEVSGTPLAVRAADVGAADDDRAGAAVVAGRPGAPGWGGGAPV